MQNDFPKLDIVSKGKTNKWAIVGDLTLGVGGKHYFTQITRVLNAESENNVNFTVGAPVSEIMNILRFLAFSA